MLKKCLRFSCVLGLMSCSTTEDEWEAFYREDCIVRFNEIALGEAITVDEINVCMEFRRSGITWGFDWEDDDDNDRIIR